MAHLTAFLNALIGKLFSEATINYSDSSTLQPLKETVQSLSLPPACCVPGALYHRRSVVMGHSCRRPLGSAQPHPGSEGMWTANQKATSAGFALDAKHVLAA